MKARQKDLLRSTRWDLLIILDACRYDTFRDVNDIEGELLKVVSPGTATKEWFNNTWDGNYSDIVYISANPYINSNSSKFFKIVDLWGFGWDDEKQTVMPQVVNEEIDKVKRKYPGKRIVAHYIQPHFPPICSDILWESWQGARLQQLGKKHYGVDYPVIAEVIKKYGVSKVYEEYKNNLKEVLSEAKKAMGSFHRVIITSDHGEAFGENGIYSHRENCRIEVLTDIPWFVARRGYE